MEITEYTEINEILNWLQPELSKVLGNNLVGIYLYGSLVWGDFNSDVSDIDLLVVTETHIDRSEFLNLSKIHDQLAEKFNRWHDRIEIAYIALKFLQNFKTLKSQIAIISPGEAFHIREGGIDWLINLYLIREQNMVVFGQNPLSIIENISKDEFLSAVKSQLHEWYDWIAHTRNSYSYQSYAVLTICRALYVVQNGKQVSKIRAAQWAQDTYPEWKDLIAKALCWRLDNKNKNIDSETTYPEVEKFVRKFSKKFFELKNYNKKLFVFVTGASGAGKTTLLKIIEKRFGIDFISINHFDSIGVPSFDEMIQIHGSCEQWQKESTQTWVKTLSEMEFSKKIVILEGSFNPDFVYENLKELNLNNYIFICLYAERTSREFRLKNFRNQPELINQDMENFAQFLKSKTLALGGSVIETVNGMEESNADELLNCIITHLE